QVLVFRDDFEEDLSAWALAGTPARSNRRCVSGRYSLCLSAPGQEAAYAPGRPIETGRLDINFFDPGSGTGVRGLLAVEFAGDKLPVRVLLADGEDRYAVDTVLAGEDAAPLPRTTGWHHLSLRFSSNYLLLGIDDAVIWSSAKKGPGGPLQKL